MKLLFAHDHRFYSGPNDTILTTGSFPARVWQRYLHYFSEVRVLARNGGMAIEPSRLALADHANVLFDFPLANSTGIKLICPPTKARQALRSEVVAADAIVARVPSEIGFRIAALAKALGKPYALEVDGCAWDCLWNHGSWRVRAYAPFAYLRLRAAVRDAPLLIFVTSSFLQRRYPTRGEGAHASNVLLPKRTESATAKRMARIRSLLQGGTPSLGTVAHLSGRYKGIHTALSALANLRSRGFALNYEVVGSGDQRPWLELAKRLGVDDLVIFRGPIPAGDEMLQWFDQIDIYLQPSLHEGLPRATIEAMSRGAACVGSTVGGIPELLPPDRCHRPRDWKGLSTLIETMVRKPALIQAASAADMQASAAFNPMHVERERGRILEALRNAAELRRQASRRNTTL